MYVIYADVYMPHIFAGDTHNRMPNSPRTHTNRSIRTYMHTQLHILTHTHFCAQILTRTIMNICEYTFIKCNISKIYTNICTRL